MKQEQRVRPLPYAVLDIAPGADDLEIRKAFKALAFSIHPDHHAGTNAGADMRAISEAKEALLRPLKGRRPLSLEAFAQSLGMSMDDAASTALAQSLARLVNQDPEAPIVVRTQSRV